MLIVCQAINIAMTTVLPVPADPRTRAGAIGFDAAITEIVWRAMIDAAIDRETRLIGAEGAAK